MDNQQIPTLLDLAKMLESPMSGEPYPETVAVARWFIQKSSKAREIYALLTCDTGGSPTPLELAQLLFTIENGEPHPEAQATAIWLVQQCEAGRTLYAKLEHLATDAGIQTTYPTWPTDILGIHRDLDRLLATPEWQDAAEILDPTGDKGVSYEPLFTACLARMSRGEGDASILRPTLKKLQASLELERKIPTLDERAIQFRDWVASLGQPEAAAAMLEQLAAGIRSLNPSQPG